MNDYRPRQFSLLPVAVKNILIINVIFFLATYFFEATRHFDLVHYLGLYFPANENFRIWQFVSYMFMHGGIGHIFFNMLSFWMFGAVLENVWGTKRFVIFYFFTGIGAALCNIGANYFTYFEIQHSVDVFLQHPSPIELQNFLAKNKLLELSNNGSIFNAWLNQPNNADLLEGVKLTLLDYRNHLANYNQEFQAPMIGASGAVFGVLFAFGYLFPNTIVYAYFIPMKAKYLVFFYGLFEIYSTWRSVPGDNIAHIAHLGGMLFGFILLKYWQQKNRNSLY